MRELAVWSNSMPNSARADHVAGAARAAGHGFGPYDCQFAADEPAEVGASPAAFQPHVEEPLKSGDVLLAHGAGGGTGSAPVGVSAPTGARAYGTASEAKLGPVEPKNGIPIDYRVRGFAEVVRTAEPGGVDFVVDPIGGNVTVGSPGLLKRGESPVSTALIRSFRDRPSRLAVPAVLLWLLLWSTTHPVKNAC